MDQKFTQKLLSDATLMVLKNAGDLLKDAEVLRLSGKRSRAYTLFHLGIEETAKAAMVLQFIILDNINDEAKQNEFLKKFGNHKAKIVGSMQPDFQMAIFLKDKEMLDKLNESMNNIGKINEAKNHSLYVSYVGGKFKTPDEAITESMLETIRTEATFRYKFVQMMITIAQPRINEIKSAGANIDPEEVFEKSVAEIKSIIYSSNSDNDAGSN